MTAKTARITILGTPDFKEYLMKEAKKEGVSLSMLVRQRCEKKPTSEEEEILVDLLTELKTSTAQAKKSLEQGLQDLSNVLSELGCKA